MSSSISADYSPTSNYSYVSDFSLPPSSPIGLSRSQSGPVPPPRLSSPHIFRDIFAAEAAGPLTRSPPRPPSLHEINYNETMQDVNRALQSANRALQTAQEAFQPRSTSSANTNRRQDVVDLTNSPPSPSLDSHAADSFLTRTLHPHDSRQSNRMANGSLHQPFYPRAGPSASFPSLFVEEDDPTSTYAGQSDSLAGPRRRFENQGQPQRHIRVSFPAIPNIEHTLFRSGLPDTRRREEQEAIRRQRVAREQWEQNRERQQQRDRLQQARDRIMASAQNARNLAPGQTSQSRTMQPSTNASASYATLYSGLPPVQAVSRSSSVSSSSVESVDLTTVNDKTDLAAALLHSQAANTTADPAGSAGQPRSALTAYKCPICLEPPRNATTTICGHLFCHECIIETLKNSENMRREDAPPTRKVKGQCPVCRKELARKDEEGNGRTLVPLEIKLISKKKMEEMRRLERKRQRKLDRESKGKGKEKDTQRGQNTNEEIFELSSDDDEFGVHGSSSQKENKAKRLKMSASEELDNELFGAFLNDET